MTEIRIPYQDRDDWIVDVIDAARETQSGDELRVTEQLAYDALARGVTKVGRLLNEVDRQSVDAAREAVGLEASPKSRRTSGTQEPSATMRRRRRNRDQRDEGGKAVQVCAEANCEVISPGNGSIGPVAARRWWCRRHESGADAGDLDPWVDPGVRVNPRTGLPTMTAAAEEHYRQLGEQAKEKREAKDRKDRQRRAEDAERLQKLEDDYRRRQGPTLPPGWR